jgi:hypothetical protein
VSEKETAMEMEMEMGKDLAKDSARVPESKLDQEPKGRRR